MPKGLPKSTKSICPECKALVDARIYEAAGKVWLEKVCSEHGKFTALYWSDAELYKWAEQFAYDGVGVENPAITAKKECPWECGLCDLHLSHTCLANIDLTNRCNLRCPICFANAATAGYVYEPTYEQVVDMLELLRASKPVPTPAVQFSGGEPTIYPKFFEVVAKARELGFSQVQVATNGLKLVEEDFCQKMRDAGVNTVYLQFDTFSDEVYEKARGRKLVGVKLKAVENCRKVQPKPLSTVLVPTIVKTINDREVGAIVKYAIENCDVIRSVNFQPVAFTGRIDREELEKQRYTLPDLVSDLVEQTDFLQREDFYPVPIVAPLSELLSILGGAPKVAFTPHPHCGLATFVFVKDGEAIPITRFIDVKGLFGKMLELSQRAARHKLLLRVFRKVKRVSRERLTRAFEKHFGEFIKKDEMPAGLDVVDLLSELFSERTKKSLGKFTWRTVMIGGMHFQDDYNYDIQRVMRCVIHYPTPDGRIIPFCAYNGGPTYREEIERKYAVPLAEWRRTHQK